jgi:hypothetical protein
MKFKNIMLNLIIITLLFSACKLLSQKKDNNKIQYKEGQHQYFVREAYNLLKYYYPQIQYTVMDSHVGNQETNEWSGKIVVGAYQEDFRDIVYGYSDILGATTSISHFWDAGTDNSKLTLLGTEYNNAYQKARIFIYGSDVDNNMYILCGDTSRYLTGILIHYSSLSDFYLTGRYYDTDGNLNYMNIDTARIWSWDLLGHAVHLLGEMCLPAHIHNDIHWPDIDLYSCKSV